MTSLRRGLPIYDNFSSEWEPRGVVLVLVLVLVHRVGGMCYRKRDDDDMYVCTVVRDFEWRIVCACGVFSDENMRMTDVLLI